MTDSYPLLETISAPSDLKKLSPEELQELSGELRRFLIDTISLNGGHFSANLGVVELTVALHRVLNTPYDRLIWDVGHQAYAHKILTGRREIFASNRKFGGLSGFPKRSESEYDAFGTGHSSTSVSAILGMAVAAAELGDTTRKHVAVIGDGALTGGMAFEALNHASTLQSNILVVYNDNAISIDPNTVALKSQEAFFRALHFDYTGPVDGHDLATLVTLLENLLSKPGPKVLHVRTTKGKGYEPAEKEQTFWHAPGKFDKLSGKVQKEKSDTPKPAKYQDVFGHTLLELARDNNRIVGITPAMPSGCSMNIMMQALPERVFDVGIAEQHAVTFAAGLAAEGMIPFCNLYSTFAQRAYDQIIHDVCVQNIPVRFCLDRAGLAGADGPTHHGAFDIAFLRCLPNMVVAAPLNESELRNLMYTASTWSEGPFSIRYPRGEGVQAEWKTAIEHTEVGKGRVLKEGKGIAILSIGTIGNEALKALSILEQEGIHLSFADMRFAKPLDAGLVLHLADKYPILVTLEDGCIQGGFGSAVLECLAKHERQNRVVQVGIPDAFIEHGSQQELYKLCGMDAESLVSLLRNLSA